MTVTSVVELDKKRCKIYLDGEFSFVLYKGELRDYNIMAGQEISDANYQEIIDVILPKRCKLRYRLFVIFFQLGESPQYGDEK